ncbi:PREDICTED: rootletin-like [Priapulus caudatus]|uniref:Rootletin-like n=1 Tax=Priapulus caudatus TaxID=37621 RepID=A0ABM1E4H8_PRICU|nr:PREDICTED: rootletin-like [Priapulus caudatus]
MLSGFEIQSFLDVLQNKMGGESKESSPEEPRTLAKERSEVACASPGRPSPNRRQPQHCCAAERDIAILHSRLKTSSRETKVLQRKLNAVEVECQEKLETVRVERDAETVQLSEQLCVMQAKLGRLQLAKEEAVEKVAVSQQQQLGGSNEDIRAELIATIAKLKEIESEKETSVCRIAELTTKLRIVEERKHREVAELEKKVCNLEEQKNQLQEQLLDMERCLLNNLKEDDLEKERCIRELTQRVTFLESLLKEMGATVDLTGDVCVVGSASQVSVEHKQDAICSESPLGRRDSTGWEGTDSGYSQSPFHASFGQMPSLTSSRQEREWTGSHDTLDSTLPYLAFDQHADIADMVGVVAMLKQQIDDYKNEKEKLEGNHCEQVAILQSALSDLQASSEANASILRTQLDQIQASKEAERQRLQEEIETLLAEKNWEVESLERQIDELKRSRKLSDLQTELRDRECEIETLQSSIEALEQTQQAEVVMLESRIDDLFSDIEQDALTFTTRLKDVEERKDRTIAELKEKLKQVEADKDDSLLRIKGEMREITLYKDCEISDLRQKLEEHERTNDEEATRLEEELSATEHKFSTQNVPELEATINWLEIIKETKEVEIDGLCQKLATRDAKVEELETNGKELKAKTKQDMVDLETKLQCKSELIALSKVIVEELKSQLYEMQVKLQALEMKEQKMLISDKVNTVVDGKKEELALLEAKVRSLEVILGSARSEHLQEVQNLEKRLMALGNQLARDQQRQQDFQKRDKDILLRELESKTAEQEQKIERYTSKLERAESVIEQLQNEVRQYKSSLVEVDTILKNLQIESNRKGKPERGEADNSGDESSQGEKRITTCEECRGEDNLVLGRAREITNIIRSSTERFQEEVGFLRSQLQDEITRNRSLQTEVGKLRGVVKTGYAALQEEQLRVSDVAQQLQQLRHLADNSSKEVDKLKKKLAEKEKQLQLEVAANHQLSAQLEKSGAMTKGKRKSGRSFPRNLFCMSDHTVP